MQEMAEELGFSAAHRRLRCVGHIFNLTARAILFGTNAADLRRVMDQAAEEIGEVSIFRNEGSIGKLHNIVKYIY